MRFIDQNNSTRSRLRNLATLLATITVTAAAPLTRARMSPMSQGNTVIEQGYVSVSRKLAGVAYLGSAEPPILAGKGIKVELCSRDWKTVLASTKTDEDSRFAFPDAKQGNVYYMQLYSPGIDLYRLRVRVDKNARQEELTIRMELGT